MKLRFSIKSAFVFLSLALGTVRGDFNGNRVTSLEDCKNYYIRSVKSGLYLGVEDASRDNFAQISNTRGPTLHSCERPKKTAVSGASRKPTRVAGSRLNPSWTRVATMVGRRCT